ncbi:zinc-binding dehydrogenase [Micromonospora ureilytica]|uniref:zinc-binding dehydrogenase n=1 Tax=Micromonospora ureilytica TaxID=709868 RepID=UPI004039DEEF
MAAPMPLRRCCGWVPMHALDQLRLAPGSTLAVTGAAGAVGGYAIQLAKAAGHRVLADAAPGDVNLVAALGADVTVIRGPGVADRFREHAPDGVDAAVDAALLGGALLPAVCEGGAVALLRGGPDPALRAQADQRRIDMVSAYVYEYEGRRDKLDLLRRLAEEGALTLRVAGRFPPQETVRAHQLLEAGGVRGRLVIEF